MAYQAPSLSEYVNLGRAMRSGMDRREDLAQRERENALRDAQEARNQESHAARMDELNADRRQRVALANAAAPAQVDTGTQITDTAGSDAFTKDPDAAAAMQDMAAATGAQPTLSQATRVNKQVFTDPAKARKAETEYNSTDATTQRQVKALQSSDPAKALALSNAAATQKKNQRAESDTDIERSVFGAQDPQGLTDFMSKKLTEQMGTEIRAEYVPSPDGKSWVLGVNVGGQRQAIGQFTNDDAGFQKAKETVFNRMGSPEALRNLEKHKSEMADKESLRKYRGALGDAAGKRAGATGGGNLNREERIRYTTLFNEAGRRLGEAKKTLGTLQKSALFMAQARTAGSPQAQQLQELQDSIDGYEEERSLYQGKLAGSQTPAGGAKPAASPAADSGPAQPSSQAEYDALPKGARYLRDGKTYIKN